MRAPPKIQVFHEAGQRLALHDFGTHVELMIGQVPILTSKRLGTEIEFGELARKLANKPAPRVLIGGLGFGQTLPGVLSVVDARADPLPETRHQPAVAACSGKTRVGRQPVSTSWT